MWKEAWTWIMENCPLLLAAAVLCVGVWKASSVFHRFKKTEKDCAVIESKVLPEITAMSDSIAAITKSINGLVIYLSSKDKDIKHDLFAIKSPVQLTALGNEVLEKIGGKKYVDENEKHLIELLEKEQLKSALDVENYSKVILIREYDSDSFTQIKNYMYHNPIYKKEDGKFL